MEPLYLSIILIGAGLAIVLLELFVPSAGILGVLAAVCLISGIVLGFMDGVVTGIVMLIITLLSVPLILAVMIKICASTPIGRRILIGRAESPDDVLPKSDYLDEIRGMVGQLGIAKTKMLPSGMVMVNGKKYDALSEGLPVEQGDAIKVVAIKGNRIVVIPFDGEDVDTDDLPARDNDILSQPIEELGLDSFDDPLG